MRLFTTFARGAGLTLCALAFTGSAFADPGNGNGNGNGGTPPGQERKAEQPAAPAPAAHGQAKKDEHAATKAEAKTEAKAEAHAKAETKAQAKVESKAQAHATVKTSASKGRSAEAHHHVIICHRTGSDSNPYVVINIPWTAWSEAHSPDTGSHPDLNGRHDILLKDPASRPGSKDGYSKEACGSPTTPALTTPTTPTMQDVTPPGHGQQKQDVCPNVEGMQTTVPAGLVVDAHGNCVAVAVAATVTEQKTVIVKAKKGAPIVAQSPAGQALGAATPGQAEEEQEAGGILGDVASAPEALTATVTTGTLPFTGIPLWIGALLGGALLAAGLVLRGAGQH